MGHEKDRRNTNETEAVGTAGIKQNGALCTGSKEWSNFAEGWP